MPSGYTDKLPTDTLINTAVLLADTGAAAAMEIIGASRGGLKFDPGNTIRELDYDGRKAPRAGLDRKGFIRAVITGTMLVASPKNLRLFEAGASGVGNVITSKAPGELFAAGDYHAFQLLFDRANGGTVAVDFPIGLVRKYEINAPGGEDGETEIPIEIEARNAADAAENAIPYTITVTDPV